MVAWLLSVIVILCTYIQTADKTYNSQKSQTLYHQKLAIHGYVTAFLNCPTNIAKEPKESVIHTSITLILDE